MTRRARAFALMLICSLWAAALQTQPAIKPQLLPDTRAGSELAVEGADLQNTKNITLVAAGSGQQPVTLTTVRTEPMRAIFRLPDAQPPGRYLVSAALDDAPSVVVGELRVVPAGPAVCRTRPTSNLWRLWWDKTFDFEVIGERLIEPDKRLTLHFGDERARVRPCAEVTKEQTEKHTALEKAKAAAETVRRAMDPSSDQTKNAELAAEHAKTLAEMPAPVCFWETGDPQRLAIVGVQVKERGGDHTFAVGTSAGVSPGIRLRVSRITPRMIKWFSFAILILAVLALLRLGQTAFARPGVQATKGRLLGWALLDQETNTFSLSKLQFLLWMVTVAYCYVFFMLSWIYIQGKITSLPPLPANFEWLLGVAGGTTLAAGMVTRARGPKGAGDSTPALADLVSTGGMLAVDRAQFLLWTLIGCGTYIAVVLRNPTESIAGLPEINADLLRAMGLSAAVYIGGKSVRLPGPVVNQVSLTLSAVNTATPNAPRTGTFVVKGQNLHTKATISLDRQPIDVTVTGHVPMPGAPSETLASELTFTAPLPFDAGDHLLRVTNIDGQYAETWFPVDQPAIQLVQMAGKPTNQVPVGTGVTVTLTGTGFRTGSSAEWLVPGYTQPIVIGADKVVVRTATDADVTFKTGASAGTGKLTLVSPYGTRATRDVAGG